MNASILTKTRRYWPQPRRIGIAATMLIVCCATAGAQATGMTQINTVATNFVTWLRGLGLVLGLGAIVWGGINMAFSQDFGRAFPKVLAGICGLVIAGYAQEIVDMFYTTTS
jgi:hypothetical protein